jgi:hypothetical protein
VYKVLVYKSSSDVYEKDKKKEKQKVPVDDVTTDYIRGNKLTKPSNYLDRQQRESNNVRFHIFLVLRFLRFAF